MRVSRRSLALILLPYLLVGCNAPVGEPLTASSYPQLDEFYGLDSVLDLTPDTDLYHTSTYQIEIAIPKPWLQMPRTHIEGYLGGRPPGTYTDTGFYECPMGFGGITYGYMRAPLGSHVGLLTATPSHPNLADSAGLVYITHHRQQYDFSLGLNQIADSRRGCASITHLQFSGGCRRGNYSQSQPSESSSAG